MQDAAGEVELRDEEGGIRSEFLHAVVAALDEGDAAKVRALALPLHEADLADLIELLRPDLLVKGADYTLERVVGADLVRGWGGEVMLAEIVPGVSTTATIARIGAGGGLR